MLLTIGTWAQEEYNPEDPPEPYTRFKLTVTATPMGYTSGSGMYLLGDVAYISTSAYSIDYTFSHWNRNGVHYSDVQSFQYTVTAERATFEAVYDYTPQDPAEPLSDNRYRLYLTNNIPEACSFNFSSGSKREADSYVNVVAYPSPDYDFLGWYEGSTLVSSVLNFNYLMGYKTTTLTARFEYNPPSPGEPISAGGDVENGLLGDVNGDGKVNVSDAVDLIGYYLNNKTSELNASIADVDKNGTINVSDAVEIIDKYLNNK